jgi:hypothetical protein
MNGITRRGHTDPAMHSTSGLEFIFMYSKKHLGMSCRPPYIKDLWTLRKTAYLFLSAPSRLLEL